MAFTVVYKPLNNYETQNWSRKTNIILIIYFYIFRFHFNLNIFVILFQPDISEKKK